MRISMLAYACACGVLATSLAHAEDHEAGVPLSPAEAAGVWTLEAQGHAVCVLRLESRGAVRVATSGCRGVLGAEPATWRATTDGMQLNGPDGAPILAFARWSNSLFVSHRDTGVDVQLRRGGPAD